MENEEEDGGTETGGTETEGMEAGGMEADGREADGMAASGGESGGVGKMRELTNCCLSVVAFMSQFYCLCCAETADTKR